MVLIDRDCTLTKASDSCERRPHYHLFPFSADKYTEIANRLASSLEKALGFVDLVPFHDENHANSTVEGAEHAIVVQATCLLHPFEDTG